MKCSIDYVQTIPLCLRLSFPGADPSLLCARRGSTCPTPPKPPRLAFCKHPLLVLSCSFWESESLSIAGKGSILESDSCNIPATVLHSSQLPALPSHKQLSPFQLSQLLVTLKEPQISLSAYLLTPFAILQPVLPGSPGLYSYYCPPCPKDNRSRSAFWSPIFLPSIGPISTQLSCGSLPSKGPLSCCSLPCVASPLSSILVRTGSLCHKVFKLPLPQSF